MSAAAVPLPAIPADVELPELYVGLPSPGSPAHIPHIIYESERQKLPLSQKRLFTSLNTLPFNVEDARAFTAQLHDMNLLQEDICYIYKRLNGGEISNELRNRLEETLEEHERRYSILEEAAAEANRRILEELRRIHEREPVNWDDVPEDPVIPIILNEIQRAALALVENVLAFVPEPIGAGPGAGAGTGIGAVTN